MSAAGNPGSRVASAKVKAALDAAAGGRGDGLAAHDQRGEHMPEGLRKELDFAAALAREAGGLALAHFRRGVRPEWKADASPVTVADLEAEALIRRRIAEAFPGDGILGEEQGEREGTSGRRWIVDPIDGTKSFIQGVPLWAVLIGLESGDDQLVGAVYLPALGELVCAARDEGCFWQDRPARVSSVEAVGNACFLYTSHRNFDLAGKRGVRARQRLVESARIVRGWGDAYGYVLVATGRAEGMFDPIINPWDIAALVPILEEAGGHLRDWDGRRSIRSGHCFASNGVLLAPITGLLRP